MSYEPYVADNCELFTRTDDLTMDHNGNNMVMKKKIENKYLFLGQWSLFHHHEINRIYKNKVHYFSYDLLLAGTESTLHLLLSLLLEKLRNPVSLHLE